VTLHLRLCQVLPRHHGRDDAPLTDSDVVNRAVLSGVISAEPQRDMSCDGDPITVLLVAFTAPDEKTHWSVGCCEVEVLDEIADPHREELRAGESVLVSGQRTGTGGLWATSLATQAPKSSFES
jgi:hypothetical protein